MTRRTVRSATALAASLSLIVPSLATVARAQDPTALRVEALAACEERLGEGTEEVAACLDEALAEMGVELPDALEAPENEAPDETAGEGETSEASGDAVAETIASEEAEAVPEAAVDVEPIAPEAGTEAPVEVEAAEPGTSLEDPDGAVEVEAEPLNATEETPPEIAETEPVDVNPIAPEAGTEAPVEVDAAEPGASLEGSDSDIPIAPEPLDATEETPPEVAETEPVDVEPIAPAAGTDAPVEVEAAEPGASLEPITRQEARALCQAELGGADQPAVQDCMADRLIADGQVELVDRLRARWASEAEAPNAATESAVAAEIASQPEPVLSEVEEIARRQTEAALAALAGEGIEDEAPAAASGEAEGTVTEQVVEADDVRSSAQDFETSAIETDRDREDGLSNREKFALGALGALAVGTILNNRARVVSNSGDRVVVQQDDGALQVLKDDDALLRQAGSNLRTETFDDGSTRTTVLREDGSRVVTVRDASLRVLRRSVLAADGTETLLIDDTAVVEPVDMATLPPAPAPALTVGAGSDDALREALAREARLDRRFSLAQVRNIAEVRALAPAVEVDTVTFDSGSAAIDPQQAGNLTGLAAEVLASIEEDPRALFLIEGHTDAVGDAAYNLALSDRRAESLALALNEYFGVPVENMVVQGYGERFLKVPTLEDERANRRATIREITELLQIAAAD
jgi:outer membrane protein OmpA-like peptidoglycan-associated protein